MPIKSNNVKGNPYHDESGKFTSSDKQGKGIPGFEDSDKALSDMMGAGKKVIENRKGGSEEDEAMKLFGLKDKGKSSEDKGGLKESDFVKTDENGVRFLEVDYGNAKAKAAFDPNAKITNIQKGEDGSFTFDLDPDGKGEIYKYSYDGHGFKNLGKANTEGNPNHDEDGGKFTDKGLDVYKEAEKNAPVRYPDGSVTVDGVWFDNENRVKSYRGEDALTGLRDANENELNDRKRLEKILSERGQNEDLEHAFGTGYFGFGSLDELEKAHNNDYKNVTDKDTLAKAQDWVKDHYKDENMDSKTFEDRVMGVYGEMKKDNKENPYANREEEQQASKLFNTDLSDYQKQNNQRLDNIFKQVDEQLHRNPSLMIRPYGRDENHENAWNITNSKTGESFYVGQNSNGTFSVYDNNGQPVSESIDRQDLLNRFGMGAKDQLARAKEKANQSAINPSGGNVHEKRTPEQTRELSAQQNMEHNMMLNEPETSGLVELPTFTHRRQEFPDGTGWNRQTADVTSQDVANAIRAATGKSLTANELEYGYITPERLKELGYNSEKEFEDDINEILADYIDEEKWEDD